MATRWIVAWLNLTINYNTVEIEWEEEKILFR